MTDSHVYRAARLAQVIPTEAWRTRQPGTPEARSAWQERLREAVRERLGVVTPTGTPEMSVLRTRDYPQYRCEEVAFPGGSGRTALGYLLTPTRLLRAGTTHPAVVCLPGHGRGADSSIGGAADGSRRAFGDWGEYQADFALQCVAQGYITLVLEPHGMGSRRDAAAREEGADATSCRRDAPVALMLGETLLGWRAEDAILAARLLQSLPRVEASRVAVMGISGGGTTALFAAALCSDIRAVVISGYLNRFADSILAVDHCPCNFVPGLAALADMPDIAGLIAPRPLWAESGNGDPIFPLHGFRAAAATVAQIYQAFGAAEAFGTEPFEGGHQFQGGGLWDFLEQRL